MSSHHIIRENQEPALVLVSEIRAEILNQLLEWSPKVFCSSTLLDWVIESGFKVDVIFGDSNKKEESLRKMQYQMPITYIPFDNDWSKFLALIQNQTVHIASNSEFNFDELKSGKELVRYSSNFKEYEINGVWKKWKNKNDKIQLEPMNNGIIENLKKEESYYSVIKDGMIKISLKENTVIREFFEL